ncbi:MAG: DUF924 family protein [Rhizobiaceae bacterium]
MPQTDPNALSVVNFWRQAGPGRWFQKSTAFDDEFRSRFLALHEQASAGELDSWNVTPEGALGLLLLLDQFPRNCFRATTRMYESDPRARSIARIALEKGFDLGVEQELRVFFYLPFSHSERLEDQKIAVEKQRALGEEALKHAQGHYDIVERFGRFPHRNPILGRDTTPDEQKFLDEGGFAG